MKTLEQQPIKLEAIIGVSEKKTDDLTEMLTLLLSSEMNLYVKTRKIHWNVADDNFVVLNTLFDVQYKQLEKSIDHLAERISNFGGKSLGIMQEFAKRSSIKEVPGKYITIKDLINELVKNHERIIVRLLKNIDDCMEIYKDTDTADFLIGLLQEHETIKWTLRKYIN
ncbi:MAG: Dps family protein [Bacteroidota bacterium]